MDTITIGIRQSRVVLFNKTIQAGLSFSWQAADAVASGMEYKARNIIGPEPEKCGNVSVKREGDEIVVSTNGQTVLVAPCAAAVEVAHALKAKARQLEEWDRFEQIAQDQAILQRSGAHLGLTNNARIQQEAGNRAAWASDLRRYIRTGSKILQQQVGTPGLGPLSKLFSRLIGV